ncbi:MAG TPA: YqgE/AlgH family protein, partial [Methylomirabilota bacterium]|nr:YqgE/AlgH family protein [Methylomirabilota bacterium]
MQRAWIAVPLLAAGLSVPADVPRAVHAQLKPRLLTGQLLVASPGMRDPRFVQTVIYMARHDGTGAMGLTVSRKVGEAPLAELIERLGMDPAGATGNIAVHWGGPVEPGRGFMLHTAEYAGEGTLPVDERFALTVHPGILRAIAQGQGPRRILFALGYAGWGPGQLEAELDRGDWITVPADEDLVFGQNYDTKWDRATA